MSLELSRDYRNQAYKQKHCSRLGSEQWPLSTKTEKQLER